MTSPRPLQIAILALVTYGMSPNTGLAQSAPQSTSPLGGGTGHWVLDRTAGMPEDTGPRMDFQFTGLPLTETIKGIQEQYHKAAAPKYLNVVIGEHLRELAETNVVTLDVKQVTVGELLKLMGTATQRTISWSGGGVSEQKVRAGYSFMPLASNEGSLTYLLQSDYTAEYFALAQARSSDPYAQGLSPRNSQPEPPAAPSASTERKFVNYYQLGSYLARYKVEDITTAMKLGWELSGAKELPTMKFHEETKLLLVVGNADQLQVVTQVLHSLSASANTPVRIPGSADAGVPGVPTSAAIPVQTPKPTLPAPAPKP